MKKILIEYCNIIGYTITGLVFGMSFFLILLNMYHYKSVNIKYIKTENDKEINTKINQKLSQINNNINSFDSNKYNGFEDVQSLNSIKTRLNVCASKIDNDSLEKILNKKEITISDVYDMQQFYQMNISNDCLIKQLYEVALNDGSIKVSNLDKIAPFMMDNIENLKDSTDYTKKVIKNNSSYYFNSESSKNDIYNELNDSYFNILNNYQQAINFIYDVSVWFNQVSKG